MSNQPWKATLPPATVGTTLLVGSAAIARSQAVSPVERRVFERINSGFGAAERPTWVVMQMGNGLTALAAPAVVLALGGTRADAARVGLAAFGGWQLAKLVKRLIPRGRPAALLDDVALRDGDPTGGGFVSGHATVATATALVAGAVLGPRAGRVAGTGAAVVALARVHVGAHLPLDVVGGVGLGLLWGSSCTAMTLPRRPAGSSR